MVSALHRRIATAGVVFGFLLLVFPAPKSRAAPSLQVESGIPENSSPALHPLGGNPLVWLEQEALGNYAEGCNGFGQSLAMSDNTAFIGSLNCQINHTQKVHVYRLVDGTWTDTQTLTASDSAPGDGFGSAIVVSGSTLLIGAPGATVNGNIEQGAVYVFTRVDGSWVQSQKLTASDGTAYQDFGSDLSFDASTALIGTPAFGSDTDPGSVYVFSNDNGTWNQSQKLTASDGAPQECFGCALAVDGETAIVGAEFANIGSNHEQGAAYVFTEQGGTWTQTQKLTANDGTAWDFFGISLALHNPNLLIGASEAMNYQGAVYRFADAKGEWTQTGKFSVDGASAFGYSMAVSVNDILIGAPGVLYLFKYISGSLIRAATIAPSVGSVGLGASTAIDGRWLLAGAPDASGGLGAAFFYRRWDIGFATDAPIAVSPGGVYTNQMIVTNNAPTASPDVTVVDTTIPEPAASFISAIPTQGNCTFNSVGPVTCSFGSIAGNGGTATANITLRAVAPAGATITNSFNTASSPPLSASKPTVVDNPPVAQRGAVSTTTGKAVVGQLVASDSDPNATLQFIIVRQPKHGTVQLQTDTGMFRYTPAPGYTGLDGFLFQASDGLLPSNTAIEAVRITN